MKIVTVKGLVLQFDSTNSSTDEDVQQVIDTVNNVLAESNLDCQPQIIPNEIEIVETTEIDMIDIGILSDDE